MPYACNGCGNVFEPKGPTVGLYCERCRPADEITAETVTDDDIREAISWLETDIGILQAALKITKGSLVPMMRKGAADTISARCLAEVVEARARAAKEPR